MIPTSGPLPVDGLGLFEQFVEDLARAEANGFTPLASFDDLGDGPGVRHDSEVWCDRFLTPEANPWRDGADTERSVHPSTDDLDDMLLTRCALDEELAIEVVESIEFILVRLQPLVPVLGASASQTDAAVEQLADKVLLRAGSGSTATGEEESYRWDFHYFPPLDDGTRFSSAPDAFPMNLPGWWSRLDGGIESGQLVFFGPKKRTSGDGRMVFLNGRAWFDGSCWDPYEG